MLYNYIYFIILLLKNQKNSLILNKFVFNETFLFNFFLTISRYSNKFFRRRLSSYLKGFFSIFWKRKKISPTLFYIFWFKFINYKIKFVFKPFFSNSLRTLPIFLINLEEEGKKYSIHEVIRREIVHNEELVTKVTSYVKFHFDLNKDFLEFSTVLNFLSKNLNEPFFLPRKITRLHLRSDSGTRVGVLEEVLKDLKRNFFRRKVRVPHKFEKKKIKLPDDYDLQRFNKRTLLEFRDSRIRYVDLQVSSLSRYFHGIPTLQDWISKEQQKRIDEYWKEIERRQKWRAENNIKITPEEEEEEVEEEESLEDLSTTITKPFDIQFFLKRNFQPRNISSYINKRNFVEIFNRGLRFKFQKKLKRKKLVDFRSLKYISPKFKFNKKNLSTFFERICYLIYKKKKNNYYFTVINYWGEVIASCSGGQILQNLKQRRNKKARSSTFSFKHSIKKIAFILRKKGIKSIYGFYHNGHLPDYLVTVVRKLFLYKKVRIRRVINCIITPHRKPYKTKKERRL